MQEEYLDFLRPDSVAVVRVDQLEFGQPRINAIPEKIHRETFRALNCSEAQQTLSTSLSVTVGTNKTVAVTRAVSTGTTITAGLTFQLGRIGTANASASINTSVTLSTATSISSQEAITRTQNVNQVVLAMTELWGECTVVESNLSVPFWARLVVDANVGANLNGYKRISDVLPEPRRTFTAEGLLLLTTASDASTRFYGRKLDPGKDCGPGVDFGRLVTERYNGSGSLLPALQSDTPIGISDGGEVTLSKAAMEKLDNLVAARNAMLRTGGVSSAMASMETPSFVAGGQHQCQSETDIGHKCDVFDLGFDDCHQAFFKLKADDCCPSTRTCGPDAATGEVKCRYGGSSIGFTLLYCVPM